MNPLLLSNNNELDAHLLSKKIELIAKHRRRPKQLNATPEAVLFERPFQQEQKSMLREKIKQIPIFGSFIVKCYRLCRNLLTPGLGWKQRLRLIPVIGSLAVWFNAIIRLNQWRQQIAQELDSLRQQQQALQTYTDQINESLHQIDETLCQIHSQNKDRDNRIASLIQKVRNQIQPEEASATPLSFHTVATAHIASPAYVDLDTFYVEFEEKFRGSRADISQRLQIYLPYVMAAVKTPDLPVADIGCGRGEWLGLLKEAGIHAIGIDLNNAMVDVCRDAGLVAECTNAIQWLKQQPEGSLAAITGFHIIEHLSFENLLMLFDAALRALHDDGVIIFETPNPENLAVGACNFYSDPTHQRPIVPAVAEFIARQRGFAKAEILRLHPYPESSWLTEDSEMARRINNILYGSQDYAVIAWKTHAD